MSAALESARYETSGIKVYLLAIYYIMMGNFSLVVAAFGVLMVILGRTVVSNVHAVLAGMFGLWGATLFIMGVLAYTLLWLNQVWARFQARS